MENNNEFDLSKLYIGIYKSKEGERIGLFEEYGIHFSSKIYKVKWNKGDDFNKNQLISKDHSYTIYKDILSDYYATMEIEENNKNKQHHEMKEKPIESMGKINQKYGLVELTSDITNLRTKMSLTEMLDVLIEFSSKMNLSNDVAKEIYRNLKSVPAYFANKNEKPPIFFSKLNYIDTSNIPKDFNTIHR